MIKYVNSTKGITASMLSGFFVGWPNAPSQETHLKILKNSTFKIMAIDESERRVVGFITAISDLILYSSISLLEVLPEYQKRGIGKELTTRMLSILQNLYMVDVMCDPELQPFYKKCGFLEAAGMVQRNYKYQNGSRIEPVT